MLLNWKIYFSLCKIYIYNIFSFTHILRQRSILAHPIFTVIRRPISDQPRLWNSIRNWTIWYFDTAPEIAPTHDLIQHQIWDQPLFLLQRQIRYYDQSHILVQTPTCYQPTLWYNTKYGIDPYFDRERNIVSIHILIQHLKTVPYFDTAPKMIKLFVILIWNQPIIWWSAH